jgi:hypothetical protein
LAVDHSVFHLYVGHTFLRCQLLGLAHSFERLEALGVFPV